MTGAASAPLDDEEKAYILKCLEEGKGSREISELTERDPRTINKFIRQNGGQAVVKPVSAKDKQDILNVAYLKCRYLMQQTQDGHAFRSLVDSFKQLTEIDRALKFDETGEHNPNRGPSMVLNFNVQGAVDLNMDVDDPQTVEGEVTQKTRPADDPVDSDDEDFSLLEERYEPKGE